MQETAAPLIVTAELPADLAAWATRLRREHFPPERNFLDAHVTLFHALAPSAERTVRTLLAECALAAPLPARLSEVMPLGRGTALRIVSPALDTVRENIAAQLTGLLTAQDSHTPRLHVTIQNKVDPATARLLQARLAATFTPRAFAFSGLALHRYRGGPWEFVHRWPFRGAAKG
jgi:hypothetical protein